MISNSITGEHVESTWPASQYDNYQSCCQFSCSDLDYIHFPYITAPLFVGTSLH